MDLEQQYQQDPETNAREAYRVFCTLLVLLAPLLSFPTAFQDNHRSHCRLEDSARVPGKNTAIIAVKPLAAYFSTSPVMAHIAAKAYE